MKYIFADSLDYVDPTYDFLRDQHGENRQPYWDDLYPHEILDSPPYDGILVSKAIVGDHRTSGKYSESQAMRFRRIGARQFLRLGDKRYSDMWLFGDCGAFSYAKEAEPPYSVDEIIEFYGEGQFTHGCSVDHIIFEFYSEPQLPGMISEDAVKRFEITQTLAEEFLSKSKALGKDFTPVGAVQGWSPQSMALAAGNLVAMGYKYLALGGLVPLKAEQIHAALQAVHEEIGSKANIHLLGFAKADHIVEFAKYGVTSFDSTSPLVRAFKDAHRNFYMREKNGRMTYFSALRIPQALENPQLKRHAKTGRYRQEDLCDMEKAALDAVRNYNRGKGDLSKTLDALIIYSRPLLDNGKLSEEAVGRRLAQLRTAYELTLREQPWKSCKCAICRNAGIEVGLFRASNRNKRRGFHNMAVFYDYVQEIKG